ncbi:MAG: Maf family protein [Acidobacteriia bacterium]|nr:Maf family protein [Terriglobia bacterium]
MTTLTPTASRLVLASASPRRRELLAALGFRLLIDPSTGPEPERRRGESAASYVVRAARLKACEVAPRHRSDLIIGADTIVLLRDHILGKPSSAAEAGDMLRSLGGRWHEVFTGICLIDNALGRSGSASSRSRVHMRPLTRSDIDWYLATGEYRDKAGAYAIQGYASLFIDRIEGCYFNIVGFPIFTFARLCRRLDLRLHEIR